MRETRQDALDRWNVGYAREWPDDVDSLESVTEALQRQAEGARWEIDPLQVEADAVIVWEWLQYERGATP